MIIKFALSFLLFYCSIIVAHSIKTNYFGYKVYDINAKDDFEKEIIFRLSGNDDYDFFDLPKIVGKPARVMVQPQDQLDFETTLTKFGIEYTVVNENVEEALELARVQNNFMRSIPNSPSQINFSTFHRHNTINEYLDQLAKTYGHRVNVRTIGKSFENRDMKSITITNGDGRPDKKVILIDAGIHAREWIAPAAALYIIRELVENYENNSELLKEYDWIILPVVNPDGYEFTHTNNRMWRKTRRPLSATCIGTDANRNFDYHWGEVGASNIECSDTYRGPTAFSEPETMVLRDLMHSVKERAKFYLTLHSYGSYLLYPWGWTSDLPDSWKDMDEVANAGADAIRAFSNSNYTVGSSTNVLYAAAGGSDDYAYGQVGIPIAITMELPKGGTGFDPSPVQIKPFVEETWIGIKAMAEKVIKKY